MIALGSWMVHQGGIILYNPLTNKVVTRRSLNNLVLSTLLRILQNIRLLMKKMILPLIILWICHLLPLLLVTISMIIRYSGCRLGYCWTEGTVYIIWRWHWTFYIMIFRCCKCVNRTKSFIWYGISLSVSEWSNLLFGKMCCRYQTMIATSVSVSKISRFIILYNLCSTSSV
jgi:hypothetical protein